MKSMLARILAMAWVLLPSFALGEESLRLLVDRGLYQESEWSRQLSVTPDDQFIIVSDPQNGVRLLSTIDGSLVNAFEGHSLEGDARYDETTGLLLTTGDRKLKVWDITTQSFLKEIPQTFHSQFMLDPYVDSQKEYLFANNVKYGFTTKRFYKRYPQGRMHFFGDRYYRVSSQGSVTHYDCLTDKQTGSFRIDGYGKPLRLYFHGLTGHLFLIYPDRARMVHLPTGTQDSLTLDFSRVYESEHEDICFSLSRDGRRLAVSGTENSSLLVFEKVDPELPFAENAREILSLTGAKVVEVAFLSQGRRFVYTTPQSIHLFDLEDREHRWSLQPRILLPEGLQMDAEGKRLWIELQGAGTAEVSLASGLDSLQLQYDPDAAVFTGTHSTNGHNSGDEPVLSPDGRLRAVETPARGNAWGGYAVLQGDELLFEQPRDGVVWAVEYSLDSSLIAFGETSRKIYVVDLERKKRIHTLPADSYVTSLTFSQDRRYLFSGSLKNEILMFDLQTGKRIRSFRGSNGAIVDTEITRDGKTLISIAEDGAVRFWDVATGDLKLTLYLDGELGHVAFTPDGFFEKSDSFRSVFWTRGGQRFEFEQFFDDFYRPGLFREVVLLDAELPRTSLSSRISEFPPPAVEFLSPAPNQTPPQAQFEVVLRVRDQGGGVDEVKLLHNGKRVPEIGSEPEPDGSLLKRFRTFALNGTNELRVSAFSSGRIECEPVTQYFSFRTTQAASDCYLLVVGINQYQNPRYHLNFAKPDAVSFLEAVQTRSEKLYQNTHVTTLYDEEATSAAIRQALEEIRDRAQPQDTFMMFYAGHGVMIPLSSGGEDFFLIPTEVTGLYNEEKVLSLGISGAQLVDFSRTIRAQKQLFVIDSCQSGSLGEAFAVRGAAEEKALAQIARAAGIHVMASASSEQFASEFEELKHGLFTYVLLRGLEGGADGAPADRKITIQELNAYLDDQLPEESERLKGLPQYPVIHSRGQDFPLVLR